MMHAIMGNPVPVRAGKKIVMAGYVSIGEWQTFDDMLKVDEGKAVLELMYCSLHRADPLITRRAVRRLTRRAATSLVELICKISLPPVLKGIAATVSDKEAERNTKTMFRRLSMMHGWTPAEICDMSPMQVYLYQTGGKDGTGIQKMSGAEYQSFLARRRSMN